MKRSILCFFMLVFFMGNFYSANAQLSYYHSTGLGTTSGDKIEIFNNGGPTPNAFVVRHWLVRDGVAAGWYSTKHLDGISIDGSYSVPTTAKTWWKRDPANATQSWGDQGNTWVTMKSGQVGIGTTVTNGYRLAVEGVIGAREVNVNTLTWSDYVFYDDYKLPSLESVERFIKQHRHLPEIPSAKEVDEKGINVGEMNALLLKKIEELTLYVIDQEKKMNKMQKEIDGLKEK